MQRKQIQTLTIACGAAFSIAALGAEPPATEGSATDTTEILTTETTTSETTTTESTTESSWHEGCKGTEETSRCEATKHRTDDSEFLLSEQEASTEEPESEFAESYEFAEGFFDGRPDPMSLQPMCSAELLERFDADGDGTLSGQEQTTTQVFLEARSAAHKDSMYSRFDLNEDGEFDADEKVEARQWMFHEQTQMLNSFVEQFDADQDGFLSDEETATGKSEHPELYYTVCYYEGTSESFSYRDGPELGRENCETFEADSQAFAELYKARQQGFLASIFAETTDEVVSQESATDDQASGETGEQMTEEVAEVSTEDHPG